MHAKTKTRSAQSSLIRSYLDWLATLIPVFLSSQILLTQPVAKDMKFINATVVCSLESMYSLNELSSTGTV